MKILVTGGAGFIGSHTVDMLLLDKENEVFVLDNLDTGSEENIPAGVTFYREDVRHPEILEIFQKNKFDAVIHFAAQTMVPFSLEYPCEDCDVNLRGALNILECARQTGVKTIVFSSSAAVYGDNTHTPLKEDEIPLPMSFYGVSKRTVEHYLRLYHELYGLNTVALRFANVYGERQGEGGEGGVVSIFGKLIPAGKGVVVYGDGGQTRDFIYVKDIAAAVIKALSYNGCGIFNASTNKETSVNDLIEAFRKVSGKDFPVSYAEVRKGDIYRSCLDNSKIIAAFGFNPVYSLEEGLKNTYKYFADKVK